jgi:hypothetical protein
MCLGTPKRSIFSISDGQRRFARCRGKRQQERLARIFDEAPRRDAHQQDDGPEDEHHEERFGGIERQHQPAEVGENAESFVSDRRGHGAEYAERGEEHHVAGVPEHHLGEGFAEFDDRARLQSHGGAGRAEDERKHDDLQHLAPGHGVDNAAGEGMFQNLREAGAAGRDCCANVLLQLYADTRLHQIHRAQADEQRHGGDDFEIENCLAADPAHGLDVARAGNPTDQSAEQQGRDNRSDQTQKDGAKDGRCFSLTRKCGAKNHARDQGDQYPTREG